MPAYTPNYNLIKPDPSENVDVRQLNANMDIIDEALRTSGGKLTILGTYPTLAQLQASVTNPSPGDAYNVGSAPPYTIYMRVNNAWQNQGRLQGADGINAYIWIKYASDTPTQDGDMSDLPDQFMGIYAGTSPTPPQNYNAYVWYKIKGATGDTGRAATIQIVGTQTANPGGEAAMVEAGDSTPGDRKYIAVIPKGETGDTGTTGTIQIVMTETLMPGLPAKIEETGDSTVQNRRYAIGIPEGRKGETGFGMRVLARRDTIEDIEAEFPNREIGSQYEVGTQQPYDVYLWTDVGGGAAGWVNQGTPITSVPPASNISADDPFNESTETDVQGVLNESGAKIKALESRTAENIPTNEGGVSVQGALDGKAALAHASRHASGGADPMAPADIGAAATSHNHSASDITSGTLPLARGGTGATTAAAARAALGLGSGATREIQFSTVTVTLTGTTSQSVEITFNTAFSASPKVLTSIQSTYTAGRPLVTIYERSTTGATLYVEQTATGTNKYTINWIAVN